MERSKIEVGSFSDQFAVRENSDQSQSADVSKNAEVRNLKKRQKLIGNHAQLLIITHNLPLTTSN